MDAKIAPQGVIIAREFTLEIMLQLLHVARKGIATADQRATQGMGGVLVGAGGLNTSTIRRLTPSRRHQLPRIAREKIKKLTIRNRRLNHQQQAAHYSKR